jgi:heme-degrading monooxygenase HmoA
VIARTWRGWTRAEDADAYVGYLLETGLRAYRETPGNRGAHLLRRDDGDRVEFVTLSFWDSLEAVQRFAGEDVGRAVFYPRDDDFLVERETTVTHYVVADEAGGA